ncbi:MAG: aldo/keto reductase [Bryobacteraceae bacterium]
MELGADYGFRGSTHYRKPSESEAIAIVKAALDAGISLIDTAPSYGRAEAIVGAAIAGRASKPRIATKVTIPEDAVGSALHAAIESTVEASLRVLGVHRIDLLQIHNSNHAILARSDVADSLTRLVASGKVHCCGASVYGEDLARDAIANPGIAVIQAPYNLLDQQLARSLFSSAVAAGRGVLVRSAFLRGILTPRIDDTPPQLYPIRQTAHRALAAAGCPISDAARFALRYCLSNPHIHSVIVGVRSRAELDDTLSAATMEPLPDGLLERMKEFDLSSHPLISPQQWTGLI